MFSCSTPLMSSQARWAVPITPRFSFSFAESFRGADWQPASQVPAAARAAVSKNWRRVRWRFMLDETSRLVADAKSCSRDAESLVKVNPSLRLISLVLFLPGVHGSHFGDGFAQVFQEKRFADDEINAFERIP